MLNISIYELEGVYLTKVIQFFFISKGKRNIRKIIQYNLQGVFQGKEYYNLGFEIIQTKKIILWIIFVVTMEILTKYLILYCTALPYFLN